MTLPAPLVAIPDLPVPAGEQAEWVTAPDGARLRAALFRPQAAARGSVVLSGGRTEPIEKYFEVIGELTARGFVVLAHDWRGQGLSHRALPDRLKGHVVGGGQAFLDDFHALLAAFEDRLPKPWIALAHSMGGCIVLLALARGEAPRFAGLVTTAPMLAIRAPVPRLAADALIAAARLVGASGGYAMFHPGRPFDADFARNVLTHDEARFHRYRRQIEACPDLALGAPTWAWLDFALEAMDELNDPENLAALTLPVTVLVAEDDRLVRNAPQFALARHLPNGQAILVPGARHEILRETDDRRAVFWRAFDAMAEAVAPAGSGSVQAD